MNAAQQARIASYIAYYRHRMQQLDPTLPAYTIEAAIADGEYIKQRHPSVIRERHRLLCSIEELIGGDGLATLIKRDAKYLKKKLNQWRRSGLLIYQRDPAFANIRHNS